MDRISLFKKGLAVEITNESLDGGKDIVEIRKRLVKALSVADDTYNRWTRNVREEYDKEIQSQIISEYLKAELTKQDVQEKFGIKDDGKINRISNETLKKINSLFSRKPHELFDSYPETLKNKFLKEYTTEDEKKENVEISFETFYDRDFLI